jgi:tape measure domain-containing protein
MSSTVDNRVVDMQFNNKQFETGVEQSTKSLDKLKKSLDFTEASRTLSGLDSASRKLNLGNIGENVQNISDRFSILGAIGFTVLQRLTNAAIDFGKKMVNNVLTPMKTGFQEYEVQMNAIQTVLANTESKGTTLKDVSDALDELNTYADKTIYNFTEMTRNIGTFTAAGVDLDTSVAAIKGIANLAAVSGSTSQQASTAMYQLSQALSSGTVKLMDWNSVVNAGMGGQVFQDSLKETARVNGIAIDNLIEQHGSFRETLSEGWLTSDVLLQTLQKFTGDLTAEQLTAIGYTEEQIVAITKLGQTANDAATKVKTFTQLKDTLAEALQSGWTQSWEIIIGDFEEAKAVFTEISDTLGAMIGASADARNKMLQEWKDMGGRIYLIEAIRNAFSGVLSIIAPIKEAFKEIFPKEFTGADLLKITAAINDFAKKLNLTGETAEKIKRIFKGVFAIFDIFRMGLVAIMGIFPSFSDSIGPASSNLLDFLANVGDFIVRIRDAIKEGDLFNVAIDRIRETIELVRGKVKEFGDEVKAQFEIASKWFTELFANVDTSGIESFFDKFQVRFKPFETLLKGVGAIFGGLIKIGQKLAPSLFKLAGSIGEFVGKIAAAIVDGLANLDINAAFDTINTGLIGAILLAIRQFITSGSGFINEASGIFGGISEILDGVRGSLEAYQQNLKAKTLLLIAAAIGILTISLVALSMIDSKKLTLALGAITALFVELMGAQAAYGKLGSSGVMQSAGLVLMAGAILIMSVALSRLAEIDRQAMSDALGTILALAAGMAIFSKLMSGGSTKGMISGSLGLVIFAGSLLILTEVVKRLGALKPEQLTNGLIGVGVMLAEIAAFMKLANLDKMGVTSGIGLLVLAAGILVLSSVVEKFGNMDVGKLQQGLIAMGAILAEIAIFTRLSGDGKGMIAISVGMTILSLAMLMFVEVITRLANLSWEELAKGLVGMGGALLIIAVAMRAMPKNMLLQSIALIGVAAALVIMSKALETMSGMTWEEIGKGLLVLAGSLGILAIALYAMTGTLAGSAALLIASVSLLALTFVLQQLGSMALTEIGIALLALAGVFLLLGIAGVALTPLVPTLLGLGTSMLLIGVGTALIGAGLLAFSLGLSALAASGMAAAVVIVGMVSTILGLVPLIINTLIDAIIIFAQGIIKATPVVAKAITELLLGVLQIIIDVTPKLLEALTILLLGLIQLIVDVTPDFIAAVVLLLVTLLQEIAAKMPDFIQAGFDILIAFLEGIRDNIAEVVTVVTEIVVEFLGAVADNLPDIIQAGWDLAIAFIDGMADGIDNNMQPAIDAVIRLAGAIVDGLAQGIKDLAWKITAALIKLAKDAWKATKDWLLSQSPSKRFMELGYTIPEGMAIGIERMANKVTNASEELGESALNSVSSAISSVASGLSGDMTLDPVIRPVVDLSEVKSSSKLIDDILGKSTLMPALAISGNVASGMNTTVDANGNIIAQPAGISLVQNNYSPKALSRFEIYRQTKNQLLTVKGLVRS